MNSVRITTSYPTIAKPLTVLFSVLVISWWLEIGMRMPWLAAFRFEFILAALVSGFALAQPRPKSHPKSTAVRGRKDPNSDILRWIVIFIVVLFASLPFAVDFDTAWDTLINHVVKFAVLGWLISRYVVSPSTLRAYLFATLVAFLKVGQEAFLGKVTGSMVWENQGVPRLHGQLGSMFGDPNALSGKTVSTIPFLWYLFAAMRRRWIKILLLAEFAFAINVIVFAASRTGYLTLIATVLLIVLFSKGKRAGLIVLIAVLGLAASTLLPHTYQDRFISAFTGQDKEGHSTETRKGLFFDALTTFKEHPLGVGPKGFRVVQARAGRNAQDTHNLYTEVLAETGVQGFFCFAMLVRAVLSSAWRARARFGEITETLRAHTTRCDPQDCALVEQELEDNRLFFATANALVLFILVRLILGLFGHDLFEIYWWIAAGIAMSLNKLLVISAQRCEQLTGKDCVGAQSGRPLRALHPPARTTTPGKTA